MADNAPFSSANLSPAEASALVRSESDNACACWCARPIRLAKLALANDDAETELNCLRSMMSPLIKRILYLAAAAAVLALGALLFFKSGAQAAPESKFVLLDGSSKTTSQFKGQVTLINFWATSCVTCVAEMPKMIATYDKYHAKGFDTVAVAMSYDPPAYVVNYAQTRKLPFKVAIDNTGSVARAWGEVKLTPTTYLVNKRGEIVKRFVGEPDFAELHKLIETLLTQAG